MTYKQYEYYMLQALIESRKARSFSSPNPNVGALLVKNNRIISKGHTQRYGCDHAEVIAIKKAKEPIKGSTLYVTLEPCSHHGKTPPCTEKIINNKIKEVVIGLKDPHPIVQGKGIQLLKKNNIKVTVNILKEKITEELQWYLKTVYKKSPYITLKAGISLDGKIADYKRNTKWITSKQTRQYSQILREENDGILVGINTICHDNPLLSYRGKKKKNIFYRIILDSKFRIDPKAKVLKPVPNHRTLLVIGDKNYNQKRIKKITDQGTEVLTVPLKNNLIDLKKLLPTLYKRNIAKLLIEGGSHIHYSFLNENCIDKIMLFIAPMLLGGEKSLGWIGSHGFALNKHKKIEKGNFLNILKDNYIYEGYLKQYVYRNY